MAWRHYEPGALLRAIYAGDEPAGVLLVETESGTPYLVRFMVDAARQRQGIGRRAVELLVESCATRAGADPGPPYVVRWHPDADAERDASWPAKEKVAMLNAVQKLEAAGPRLGHPHSSSVRGEVGMGFRELRPRAGRSRWRPIYRRVTSREFVIFAVGPEAGVDSRGFEAAVGRAVQRFASFKAD